MRSLVAVGAVSLFLAMSGNAHAACQKLGFSVNDYGKIGPANDAKKLLDKYIAEWTAKHGIKKYRTGKKTVTCELFLDFGFLGVLGDLVDFTFFDLGLLLLRLPLRLLRL